MMTGSMEGVDLVNVLTNSATGTGIVNAEIRDLHPLPKTGVRPRF